MGAATPFPPPTRWLTPLCLAGGATSGSVLPSLFSLEAPPGGVGMLLGVCQSVHSAAGVVGPVFSGWLFATHGTGAPAAVASGLCLLSCAVFVAFVQRGPPALATGDLPPGRGGSTRERQKKAQ